MHFHERKCLNFEYRSTEVLWLIRHWFRLWLGAEQVPSHYLNQWWLSLMMRHSASIQKRQCRHISCPMHILHAEWPSRHLKYFRRTSKTSMERDFENVFLSTPRLSASDGQQAQQTGHLQPQKWDMSPLARARIYHASDQNLTKPGTATVLNGFPKHDTAFLKRNHQ